MAKLKPVKVQLLLAKVEKLTLAKTLNGYHTAVKHETPLRLRTKNILCVCTTHRNNSASCKPKSPAAVIGCLPLKKQAIRPWQNYSYRRLGLTGARWSNVTYRCVFAATRSAVRRQCLVQYMIALTGAVYPAVPLKTSQVYHSQSSPCYSKAHGVLSASDLTTMHCVNC